MFEVPNAKRVRRDEILSRTSSSPPSSPPPEIIEDGHARLGELLNLDPTLIIPGPTQSNIQDSNIRNEEDEEEEQEFEFRLFSSVPAKTVNRDSNNNVSSSNGGKEAKNVDETQTQKLRIRLRSPTPVSGDAGEGRFVNPFRGWEYYFSSPGLIVKGGSGSGALEEEKKKKKKKEFEDVAVNGDMVLGWALKDWPGCHLPWRVIHLKRQHTKLPPASKDVYVVNNTSGAIASPKSRKKPGKKRRIQLRKRAAAAEAAKETEAEKRNRKNRERKIKRRQKAREMKAAAAASGGQSGDISVAGNAGDGNGDVSSQEE